MLAQYRRYNVNLNTETDADVIALLESQPSMTDAIRKALRERMKEA